jgi:hypothetical protein
MRRLACLVGLLVVAGTVTQAAGHAAEPRALLDAPRAGDVAVAGPDVLVAATTTGGGARLSAVPAAGGPARVVLDVPPRGRGWRSVTRMASSAQLTAMQVAFIDPSDNFRDWRVYAGPPAGPLALVQRARHAGSRRVWTPVDLDVHGERLLVQELRQPGFAFRLVVRAPDGTAPPVPQNRFAPAAVAGEQLAYVDRSFIRIVDWRTGQLNSTMDLGRNSGDIEDRHLDMTDGARVVAAIDGRLMTGAPGVPIQQLPGSSGVSGLTAPRFAGERVAALAPARRGAERPVVIDPAAGTLRRIGPPSTTLSAIAASEATVAWLANGCVLAADVVEAPLPLGASPQTLELAPPGPCARSEVILDEHDQVLRGRTLRVTVTCVAAPPPGCQGVVVLGRGGGAGQGRFRVTAGRRRVVPVKLTRGGMASVRHQLGLDGVALFRLGARVTDGRVSPEQGTGWVLIDPAR